MAFQIDDFNRADGGLGSNWGPSAVFTDVPAIASQQVVGDDVTADGSLWVANTFGPDQYAKARITGLVEGYVGFILRETDGLSGYRTQFDLSNHRVLIIKYVGNVLLSVPLPTLAIGDTIGFYAIGSYLDVRQNGLSRGGIIDTSWASGSLGISIFKATSALGDFEGGEVGDQNARLDWTPSYTVRGGQRRVMVPSGMGN